MRTITTFSILLLLSFSSVAQSYRIYTARANGNWNNAATWNQVPRTDGVTKHQYIIPLAYTVTAPANYDFSFLGDMELVVSGTLNMARNAVFNLTQNSKIEVPVNGKIRSNGIAAIAIGNSLKMLSFRARVMDGPLFTDFLTTGFASLFTLSVDFLTFTAAKHNADVVLKWSVANEKNNSHFEAEVSMNGRDWSKIGEVKAKGTSTAINFYTYTHKKISGTSLSHRLKQIDIDGKYDYSTVVVIKSADQSFANITSSSSAITIDVHQTVNLPVLIRVISLNGQVLLSQFASPISGKITVATMGLIKGVYVVQVANENASAVKQLFIN